MKEITIGRKIKVNKSKIPFMRKVYVTKPHTVVLYDSIENLPMDQFSKMQKYQMIESGIGKDLSGFDKHFESATEYLKHDKKDKAIGELKNIRHLFWHVLNEIDPSQLSFCCMVFSIDGIEITDYSESSLLIMREKLSDYGLTQKIIADQAVKKKSMMN